MLDRKLAGSDFIMYTGGYNARYYSGRYYFDGKYRFSSPTYSSFYAYDKDGVTSSWGGGHGACDKFHVKGDVLFIDSNITYHASLLDLTRLSYKDGKTVALPEEIRTDWMRSQHWRDEEIMKKCEELFEKEQEEKRRAKKEGSRPQPVKKLQQTTELQPAREIQPDREPQPDRQSQASRQLPPAASGFFGQTSSVAAKTTGSSSAPASKLEYCEGFEKYLEGGIPSSIRIPKAADRNWFALRLGSSKVRIECSLSSRKQMLRVGLFMEPSDKIYGNAARHKVEIDALLGDTPVPGAEIRWDNTVADANVSVFIPYSGLNTTEQYEVMKTVICRMADALQYIPVLSFSPNKKAPPGN